MVMRAERSSPGPSPLGPVPEEDAAGGGQREPPSARSADTSTSPQEQAAPGALTRNSSHQELLEWTRVHTRKKVVYSGYAVFALVGAAMGLGFVLALLGVSAMFCETETRDIGRSGQPPPAPPQAFPCDDSWILMLCAGYAVGIGLTVLAVRLHCALTEALVHLRRRESLARLPPSAALSPSMMALTLDPPATPTATVGGTDTSAAEPDSPSAASVVAGAESDRLGTPPHGAPHSPAGEQESGPVMLSSAEILDTVLMVWSSTQGFLLLMLLLLICLYLLTAHLSVIGRAMGAIILGAILACGVRLTTLLLLARSHTLEYHLLLTASTNDPAVHMAFTWRMFVCSFLREFGRLLMSPEPSHHQVAPFYSEHTHSMGPAGSRDGSSPQQRAPVMTQAQLEAQLVNQVGLPSPAPSSPGMSGEMYEGTIEPSRLCKYYCPICMLYFHDLNRTACCANYICYECAVQYVQGKSMKVHEALLSNPLAGEAVMQARVECPFCNEKDLKLDSVNPTEEVRKYEDSPSVHSCTGTQTPTSADTGRPARPWGSTHLSVGESFDSMRLKMVGFESVGWRPPTPTAAPAQLDAGGVRQAATLDDTREMPMPKELFQEALNTALVQDELRHFDSQSASADATATAAAPLPNAVPASPQTASTPDNGAAAAAGPTTPPPLNAAEPHAVSAIPDAGTTAAATDATVSAAEPLGSSRSTGSELGLLPETMSPMSDDGAVTIDTFRLQDVLRPRNLELGTFEPEQAQVAEPVPVTDEAVA